VCHFDGVCLSRNKRISYLLTLTLLQNYFTITTNYIKIKVTVK